MEEDSGNDQESNLHEIIRQLNETNEQLTTDLKEKDNLIKALQKEILELKTGAENKLLNMHESKNMNSQPLDFKDVVDTHENQNKNMKSENVQVERSNNFDDNSEESVAKGLRNPLILTKILRNIRSKDLVNCRLVNRDLRDLSTEILLKRKNIQLNFRNHRDSKSFMRTPNYIGFWGLKHYKQKQLCNLASLLNTSAAKFPCASFGLDGNLKFDDAQAFLTGFGSNIKELELGETQKTKFVRKLFVKQIPNIEHLELDKVEIKEELLSENPTAIKLSKLSSLISLKLGESNSSSLVKEIVDAAPNLQQCTGYWSMKEIEFLLPRLHTLTHFSLAPEPGDVDALEKLTKMKLQLKYFEMNYNNFSVGYEEYKEEAGKVLLAKLDNMNSKILSSNRLTLEEIKLTPHAYGDNLIKWPQMGNVLKLTISGDEEDHRLNFPSFKISEIFPKLHTFCVTDNENSDDLSPHECTEYSDVFKDVAPSVKVLEIYDFLGDALSVYHKTFPNVQQLSLNQIQNYHVFALAFWNMTKLKRLKLKFGYCSTSEIDALFTGIDRDTCKFLRSFGRDKIKASEMAKLRENPSILDLTELEELHLPKGFEREIDEEEEYFDDENYEEHKKQNKPSFVSFTYAFNLMPKLCVFS